MSGDHPKRELPETGGELPEQPPPVSRETPAPSPAAAELFGERLPTAAAYADLLCADASVRGLIGPREVPRVWDRHLVNSAVLGEVIEDGAEVCDLGSGAGLPGIPLAILRPRLSVTLVEPLLRRTVFLEEAVERLGLGNVRVLRARAEDLHGSAQFDVVTSRAVAPLDRVARWSLPLVRRRGGAMLAIKGSSAAAEIDWAGKALRQLDVGRIDVLRVGAAWTEPAVTVVRITHNS